MKRVKTAKGQMLDMGALSAKYETTRAVSNVPVNARGDIIDNRNNIKVTKEEIAKKQSKAAKAPASTVSIKDDTPAPTGNSDQVVEIGRNMRERSDGTIYYEVEYSDGSIEEVE